MFLVPTREITYRIQEVTSAKNAISTDFGSFSGEQK